MSIESFSRVEASDRVEETVLLMFPPLVLAPRLFPASRSTPPRISGEAAPLNTSTMSHPSPSHPSSSSRSRRGVSLRLDQRILDRFGPVIGPSGLAVYVALARQASSQGPCTVSFFELSRKLGSSRRQVLQALAKLESLGLIRTERRPGYTNRYHLRPLSTTLSNFPQPVPERNGEPSHSASPPVSPRDEEKVSPTPRGVPPRDGSSVPTAPPPDRGEPETGENSTPVPSPTPPLAAENIKRPKGEGGPGETLASTDLLARLTSLGVNEGMARWLVAHHRPEEIETQLRYLPFRRNVRDPAAALVRSIQENWEEPEGYRHQQSRLQEQKQSHQEAQQRLRNGEAIRAERETWERRKASLPPKQLTELQRQAEANVRRKLTKVWPTDKKLPQAFVEAELRTLLRASRDHPPRDPPSSS